MIENIETGLPCNTRGATAEEDVCLAACKSTGRDIGKYNGRPDTDLGSAVAVSKGAEIR